VVSVIALGRIARNRSLLVAVLASLIVFVAGFALGFGSIGRAWAQNSLGAGGATNAVFGSSVFAILAQNLIAVMFLYSGVLTFGLTSVLSIGMVSTYVGATMAVGVTNSGWTQLASATGAYALLEFTGCIVAAAAGLHPVCAFLAHAVKHDGASGMFGAYLDAVATSLKILGCAVALILTAAAIEAIVIAIR
jgi:uncharacterized membrane protein SpoIIM required for sporulation